MSSLNILTPPFPPLAAKRAWRETRHGEVVTDDYRWLHQKEQAEVIDYLDAENAYTDAMTAGIQPLADKLYDEIKGRLQEVDLTVPVRRGAYYYYARLEAGQQYPINCRRRAGADLAYDGTAAEQVLLDQNKLAHDQPFFAVSLFAVSPNDRYLAYSTDTTGYRQYQLHILDLQTGTLLDDTVPRVSSVAWAAAALTLLLVSH